MHFTYSNAHLPEDEQLIAKLDAAAGRAFVAIRGVSTSQLAISDYNKRYFSKHQRKLRQSLQKYAYLLSWCFANHPRALSACTFVDYGGGSGVMSMLARAAGIGTVIYNDIYDVSCRDAQILGQEAGLEANYYIQGDIDALTQFLRAQTIVVDAIGSYDVIEHIYQIEQLFRTVAAWPSAPFRIVMASGANERNSLIRYLLTRQHKQVELEDREEARGHKQRDTLESYLAIRKRIVADTAPTLSQQEIEYLARMTRGLIVEDIETQVAEYVTTGSLSYKPDHPTNTCDPYTGNWAEHLLDVHQLTELLEREGLTTQILSGYYGSSHKLLLNLLPTIVNPLIRRMGERGLFLAPYYIIYATR